jgi:biopolymer transport protein ExbD/biopolymer transport protein TolR
MAGLPTRFKSGDSLYQPLADINVTPLVDVMLVLLIIFMVTAPLLAKGMKVDLPQSKAAQPLNPKEPIVVAVSKDGKVALGADEVSAEALVDGIKAMMGSDTSRIVHVRGDKEANYGEVIAVMDRLATNGITHIAILTDSRGKTGAAARAVPATSPAPAAAGGAAK